MNPRIALLKQLENLVSTYEGRVREDVGLLVNFNNVSYVWDGEKFIEENREYENIAVEMESETSTIRSVR